MEMNLTLLILINKILLMKFFHYKGDNELIINRKLTISYYNKDGLFARGSVYYAFYKTSLKHLKPEAPTG